MNIKRKAARSLILLILTLSLLQLPLLFSYPEYGYDKASEIELIGQVEHVYDGDTIRLSDGKVVRLADIDAPESNEQGYSESTEALKGWILGKEVSLDIDDVYETDRYGRIVCVVYVPRYTSFVNINKALILSEHVEESDFFNEFDPDDWRYINHYSYLKQAREEHNQVEEEPPRDDFEDPVTPTIIRFVASSQSDKYHKSSCYHAKRIKQENIRAFSTSTQAENEGYSPCKTCLPHLQPEPSPELDPDLTPDPNPEPEPEPEPEPVPIPTGSYVGSKNSDKYHKPDCYYVTRILPENLRIFSSKSAAESAGYVPCKRCLPELQPEPEPEPEPEPTTRYVASKNSDVFHHTWCSYVDQILSSNKIYFSSRQAAVNSGRRPCSRCKP